MVRDDSRYAILPVMPPTKIKGWTVYDSYTGLMITPPEGPFATHIAARDWLNKERPD